MCTAHSAVLRLRRVGHDGSASRCGCGARCDKGSFEAQGRPASRGRDNKINSRQGKRSGRRPASSSRGSTPRRSKPPSARSRQNISQISRWRHGWWRNRPVPKSISFPDELKKNTSNASARVAMQTQEAEFAARLAAIENERKMIDQQMLQIDGLDPRPESQHQRTRATTQIIAGGDSRYELPPGKGPRPKAPRVGLAASRSRGQRTDRPQLGVDGGDERQNGGVGGQTPTARLQPKSGNREAAACDE